jgi:pyridoxamine 5'-phosphate oxidase
MQLATVDKNLQPDIRTVLLKGVDNGLVFFTNYHSEKGQHLENNPKVALHFLWLELERQIRIQGTVEKLTDKENDTYFYSRPFESRVGAIASHQSKVLPDRTILENSFRSLLEKDAALITRPEHWGGYRVIPNYFEFWQGRESRLHDRIVFSKELNHDWSLSRLYP